jgi:hypothetical protein
MLARQATADYVPLLRSIAAALWGIPTGSPAVIFALNFGLPKLPRKRLKSPVDEDGVAL